MTIEETGRFAVYLNATYPQTEITKERVAILHEHFSKFSVQQMREALKKFAENSQHNFAPSVPELHRTLRGSQHGARKLLNQREYDRFIESRDQKKIGVTA